MADASIGTSYLTVVPKFEDGSLSKIADAGPSAGAALGDGISAGLSAKAVVIGNVITGALKTAISSAIGIGKEIAGGIYEGYAANEQLVGGIQKLFGEADYMTVVENASKAWQTAGMSANDYMQTVTSFSASLVNSLGGDTEAAAALADQAIQDMADNVNTFGSDAGMVQNAIMGIAKGNYFMLDNLNLGFAGNQQGMLDLINASGVLGEKLTDTSQLADVGFGTMLEAIHAVQQDMSITGTTANEAMGTLEGSANAAKSAWQNVLTAIGSGDASQVKTAASGLVDALFGTIDTETGAREGGLIENLTGLASRAFEALGAALPGMVDSMLSAMPPEIGEPLRQAFETIGTTIEKVAPLVSTAIGGIVSAVGTIAPVVAPLLPIIAAALGAVKIVGVITSIVGAISGFIGMAGTAIGMISGLPALISAVVTVMGGPVTIIAAIVGAIVAFIATNEDARNAVIAVWEGIKGAVSDVVDAITTYVPQKFNELVTGAQTAFTNMQTAVVTTWNNIKSAATNAASQLVSGIKGKISGIASSVKATFDRVKDAIMTPINAAKDAVQKAISKISSIISGVKLQLPHINLPHFSISGGKAPWGIGGKGSLPKFSVSWYAKGGYFDSPTLFAGVGERGGEFVWPSYAPYLDRYADALASKMGGGGVNVYLTYNGSGDATELVSTLARDLRMMRMTGAI